MPRLIAKPTVVPAAGRPPKIIEEFFGRVNSQTAALSIAKMTSPSGWREPGQTPEFDEYTIVLKGELQVETRSSILKVARRASDRRQCRRMGVLLLRPPPRALNILRCACRRFSPSTVHRDE